MPQPRCVLIDLDDTLIDRSGAFVQWCGEFVRRRDLDQSAMARLHEFDNRSLRSRPEFLTLVDHEYGLGSSPQEFMVDYRATMTRNTSLYDGVSVALTELRNGGWKIWIVTNGETEVQEAKIAEVGLEKMIDGWIISEAVGMRKPSREIFDLARRRAGDVPETRTWMVGDNEDADITGAHTAGLRTAWVSHSRRWPIDGWDPTILRVDTASAIAEIIAFGD